MNFNKTNMRFYSTCFLIVSFFNVFSQDIELPKDSLTIVTDSLYREDQFYIGITYNSLLKKPSGLSQDKLSAGFSLGFLRDMPINKSRTVAIAPGIGIMYNNYNQNLRILSSNEGNTYSIIEPDIDYSHNRFEQLFVEVPIEFRWRASTPETYKFWRIYTGFKFSYLLYDKSVYDNDGTKSIVKNNTDFNKILYGAYLAVGYNTINVYGYYGFNSIFKSAKIDNEPISMSAMNIGIIFYIL